MQIAKHKVVTIDYTLTDPTETVLDSSAGGAPLSYIHGVGGIIPGLESALEGRSKGDAMAVSIIPEHAYGDRDEALVQKVPRDRFDIGTELKVGMRFETPTRDGTRIVTLTDIGDDLITVDGNHPLAVVTLNFAVTVIDVRDATQEELSHGHAHGPGEHES
ncbi:MAG: FKBP-type peptidyl-prolyl cis-trans isomerase [Burkholderiales bacterium]